jgi:hypothetical protein
MDLCKPDEVQMDLCKASRGFDLHKSIANATLIR